MVSVIRSGQSWLLREPPKELERSEVRFKRRQGEETTYKEEKDLLHERDGGHLRDEDDCQLPHEVHRHCHQAKSKPPHWTARGVPPDFGLFKKATLVELLDSL